MTTAVRRLGFWSGLLSAAAAVAWFVTYSARDAIWPMPPWQDLEDYAAAYSPLRVLYVYPSLVLAVTFLVLLVCVHRSVPKADKVWTHSALALGIVYSVMATINYNIQAVAIPMTFESGNLAGVEMFLPDNVNGVFTALANSYGYMALAMVAASFAFRGDRLARSIRWLLFAQVITAVGQFAWSMFGLPMGAFIATSLVWVVGAPVAFVLIAIWFRSAPATDAATPRVRSRPAA